MRPRDRDTYRRLDAGLAAYDEEVRPLPGIIQGVARISFLEQLLESVHRVKYVLVISHRELSDRRADPDSDLFDPVKAAIIHRRRGAVDEAIWLVFLFVHFGKHARGGWRYLREVYGRVGEGGRWDWSSISNDPAGFRVWLEEHLDTLKREGVPGGFGNHRKYQSLDPYSPVGTGAAFESYVNWVGPSRSHVAMFSRILEEVGGDPRRGFDALYQSMRVVASFGRTARFDYLTMIGKLGLVSIEPGSAYLSSSTGPLSGARLLFGGDEEASISPADLDRFLLELDTYLEVGMQALEDAVCNWQKSPTEFKRFRG